MDHFRIKAKAIHDLLMDHPCITPKQREHYRKWFNEIIKPSAEMAGVELIELNTPPTEEELTILFETL
ncbi:hypothetical protein [Bacteroides sp. 51]|uniref:hypothetical protein n=1 Tax=Bacteroides sp. 51 TaxID=2302938 RepID=UPI0013D6F77B|nr:hypothetical protein [Bacteroides sp. 51]NDV83412.1 hypothetical protein [Bacteroides sp. 51]